MVKQLQKKCCMELMHKVSFFHSLGLLHSSVALAVKLPIRGKKYYTPFFILMSGLWEIFSRQVEFRDL
jgi:hypothetical protein